MSNFQEQPVVKRAYDAKSRRERAVRERGNTRERVLAAARRRFLADGYTATKMTDIADEAGVAIASVYRAGRGKAELIQMIIAMDNAKVRARDAPEHQLRATDLPAFPAIAAEPDPERQVEMIADRIADTLETVAPLWTVLRDAAGVDAGAAEAMQAQLELRASSFEVAVGILPAQRLRMSKSDSIDTLWALSSPEMYLMLRSTRSWSTRRYRTWLRRMLLVQLLTPSPAPAPTLDGDESAAL